MDYNCEEYYYKINKDNYDELIKLFTSDEVYKKTEKLLLEKTTVIKNKSKEMWDKVFLELEMK
jgi:hypothetical protein